MSYYKVYKDRASEWRWRYVATNGRTISDSGRVMLLSQMLSTGLRS